MMSLYAKRISVQKLATLLVIVALCYLASSSRNQAASDNRQKVLRAKSIIKRRPRRTLRRGFYCGTVHAEWKCKVFGKGLRQTELHLQSMRNLRQPDRASAGTLRRHRRGPQQRIHLAGSAQIARIRQQQTQRQSTSRLFHSRTSSSADALLQHESIH
jgi:hypothetical protein